MISEYWPYWPTKDASSKYPDDIIQTASHLSQHCLLMSSSVTLDLYSLTVFFFSIKD